MILTVIAGLLIFLIILILIGPRPVIDDTIQPFDAPRDLDAYLEETESKLPIVIEGAQKKIIWFNEDKSKTPYAIVYLPGFGATWMETYPLADIAAKEIGANIYYPRLKGHALGSEALSDATVNDWLNDAYQAYVIGKKLGDKVILMGMSNGAILAMWLTARYPDIEAVIALSPNFDLADKMSEILLWPWGNVLVRNIVGEYREFEAKNEQHAYYWTSRYRSEALIPMKALVSYGKRIDYATITVPTIFFYYEKDNVIDIPYMKHIFGILAAQDKRMFSVRNAEDHVLAGEIVSPKATDEVAAKIIQFLHDVGIE